MTSSDYATRYATSSATEWLEDEKEWQVRPMKRSAAVQWLEQQFEAQWRDTGGSSMISTGVIRFRTHPPLNTVMRAPMFTLKNCDGPDRAGGDPGHQCREFRTVEVATYYEHTEVVSEACAHGHWRRYLRVIGEYDQATETPM